LCNKADKSTKKLTAQDSKFAKLGLLSASDFITHLPLRYEDETVIHNVNELTSGIHAQLEGKITDVSVQYKPRKQLLARLTDKTGSIWLRWLYFYPGQVTHLKSQPIVRAIGEVRRGYNGLEIVHPRLNKAGTPLPTSLTPVYSSTQGLSQPSLRKAIALALKSADLSETLPEDMVLRFGLVEFDKAINTLHNPSSKINQSSLLNHTHPAWQRIKFDELLAQQLALNAARKARYKLKSPKIDKTTTSQNLVNRLISSLSFKLTKAQCKVVDEILHDLGLPHPMNRLLQGDVGSGKTIVATIATAQIIDMGLQVAIMAPTEIVAEQHFEKISHWLAPLGVNCAILTGGISSLERKKTLTNIKSGVVRLVVGTQALIQETVEFCSLGLVVLDEQHSFGVGQRLTLSDKGETSIGSDSVVPHQLNMSATPIPRTLAMTYLADMDVSILDELPPGRTPVLTKLISNTRRDEVINQILYEIEGGRQAYWVCPLVEESESLQLETAIETYEILSDTFKNITVGLVHGRMSANEKQLVMDSFRAGTTKILVATTVIEVGVDVPNASIMVIDHAERFGLSQLHQLRGRVGRGNVESICILLFQQPLSETAKLRLQAMYETTDGFEIAQRDLEIRGPGEFLGIKQSGQLMLRFADPDTDKNIIELVKQCAKELTINYPDHAQRHVQRWLPGKIDLLRG